MHDKHNISSFLIELFQDFLSNLHTVFKWVFECMPNAGCVDECICMAFRSDQFGSLVEGFWSVPLLHTRSASAEL